MEVTLCLIILTILGQSPSAAQRDPQSDRLIFDLTRPVNELIGKNFSQEDFLSDVHLAFDVVGANVNTSRVFYEAVGITVEELNFKTTVACKVIHKTLGMQPDTQLIVSWSATSNVIRNELDTQNKTFDRYTPQLVFHITDDILSSQLDLNIIKGLLRPGCLFVGIRYEGSFVGHSSIEDLKRISSIVIVNLKFGTTRGVTESFGLFQTRMKFLYQNVIVMGPIEQVVYYPDPNSVGEHEHQKLLIQYATIWTTSNKTLGSILVQVPCSRKEASTMTKFSIIPRFASYRFHGHLKNDVILPFLFKSFQRYQMIFVNDQSIWNLWNSMPEDNIRSLKLQNMQLSVRLALDLPPSLVSDDGQPLIELKYLQKQNVFERNRPGQTRVSGRQPYDCPYYPNCPHRRPSQQPDSLNVSKPGILVVTIREQYFPDVPPQIAKPSSPILNIGCIRRPLFESSNHSPLNESDVEHFVSACQSINGSLYILTVTIRLEWFNEQDKYSFYFENTIRKKLHAVNWFRKGIIQRVPLAKVYFELVMEEINPNSLFCDELKPTVNLYFEGIFNWAKLEDFPIIKPINNKIGTSFFSDWFTLLRRLNYPYPDWAVEERRRDQTTNRSVTGPAYLIQDYLKSVHDWEPDSCIDWIDGRWEIPKHFFHNSKIGTAVHPNTIMKNQKLTKEDFITMLHFIFYRFRLVEIIITFDFRNILGAIEHKVAYADYSAEIFMKYAMEKEDHQEDLAEFKSFLVQLKESKMFEKRLFKGVHTELVVDSDIYNGKGISNSSKFESVLIMMKNAKSLNLTCGIELPTVKMCTEMLKMFALSKEYLELIDTINYFVCKETFDTLAWRDKAEFEYMLDSHLFLTRTMLQIIPHLRVYFRVEFVFQIDFEDHVLVDRYTSFLALFKSFGNKYDISYLFGVAFDGQLVSNQNGWWGITNYSDLTNPNSYVEKVTVFRGQQMWYPSNLPSGFASYHQDFSLVIIVSSVGSGVVLLLVVVGVCFGLRYRKLRHLNRLLSDAEVQEFLNGRVSANTEPVNMEMNLIESVELDHIKFSQNFKLNLQDITIDFDKILGSGAFGMVYKGFTKNIPSAIKRPNADCSKTTFKSVLAEVKVLSYIGNHPNLVGFLGAYVDEIQTGVLYICTELCSHGSLQAFLRTKSCFIFQSTCNENADILPKASELYIHELNTFAMEVALGMEYIESRHVVHGDLATRNVLLNDNLVCKIGDFGLSRKMYEYQKYVKKSQEPLPWKWMAPESLTKMEFTSKSDVWSFGVTLWEIYSLGKIPYAGLNWNVEFAKDLENGLRLPIPDCAPDDIFSKMLECWKLSPEERPTFAEIVGFYKSLGECAYTVLDPTE